MNKDIYEFQIEFCQDAENENPPLSDVQNGFVLATSMEDARKKIDDIEIDGYKTAVHVHLYDDDVILV